ncbi:MAG: sensor histidine kinase [Thermosynechococcaceae cyanobacterium]
MRFFPRPNHPFPLLLYLEWILLGIAVVATLPPLFMPRRFPLLSIVENSWGEEPFVFGILLCIGAMGLAGFRLPILQSRSEKILFTALGFGLSWLAVSFGELRGNSFAALLLVVVVRACLLFAWTGRLAVTVLAFTSFVLRLYLSIQRVFAMPFLLPGRSPLRPLHRAPSPEKIQTAVFNLALNSTLLFGLVLIFVLLMVGAILNERHSRDRLALANDRLRRYALLIESQTALQERNRIAREIHDSVGHALTAQSIQLENVAMWLPDNPDRATDHLAKARSLGKEALQNVRQSVATLRKPPLEGKALPEALQNLAQTFERTTGIDIDLQVRLTQTLPPETAIALYRIVQEATTNIAKHSHATRVGLSLIETPTDLELKIEDNGRGFQPTQNTTGFGLQSMRERTEALGGLFRLKSQPEEGCCLSIALPHPKGQL